MSSIPVEPNNTTDPIDDYIAGFPAEVQAILRQIRETIRRAAPEAAEALKYGIPTFVLHGNLVHFGGYKTHIGFYPTPAGIEHFRNELSAYEISKGTVKFPLGQPLPLELIERIVQFRVEENLSKAVSRRKKRNRVPARPRHPQLPIPISSPENSSR